MSPFHPPCDSQRRRADFHPATVEDCAAGVPLVLSNGNERTSTLRPDRTCAAFVNLVLSNDNGRTSTLRPDRTFAADFHSLPTAWRDVGLGFAHSNDNERISTPRPWGIAAKFVPKSAKGFRSPTGAALIHPLSAHRIICGLPSGSGETRRLATPKPSAAVSRLSKLAEKLPRSVFRLRRASRPNMDFAPAGRGGQSPRWRCRCPICRALSVRLRFAFLNARLRTIQRVCFAYAKRGGQSPRWWWARGGDAEAIVKLCTRVVVPLLPRPRAGA